MAKTKALVVLVALAGLAVAGFAAPVQAQETKDLKAGQVVTIKGQICNLDQFLRTGRIDAGFGVAGPDDMGKTGEHGKADEYGKKTGEPGRGELGRAGEYGQTGAGHGRGFGHCFAVVTTDNKVIVLLKPETGVGPAGDVGRDRGTAGAEDKGFGEDKGVMGDRAGVGQDDKLQKCHELIGQNVEIKGKLFEQKGLFGIEIQEVKKLDEKPGTTGREPSRP